MTFKFLEVLQLFVKVLSHTWGLWIFSRASVPSWPRRQTTQRRRGQWRCGGGVFCASWNDTPRICWIKSLHLDIIVLLLCWELLLPEWDQISGPQKWRPVKTPSFTWHHILWRRKCLLALLVKDQFVYGLGRLHQLECLMKSSWRTPNLSASQRAATPSYSCFPDFNTWRRSRCSSKPLV